MATRKRKPTVVSGAGRVVAPAPAWVDAAPGAMPDEVDDDLMGRVVGILEQARSAVVRSVNSQMVVAYWLIGREIVAALQAGEGRAGYGQRLLPDLAALLTRRFGRGYSQTNLRYFRLFYQAFADRQPIHHSASDELTGPAAAEDKQAETFTGFSDRLSWTHYRTLCRVVDVAGEEKLFFVVETKGSLFDDALRDTEGAKIKCGVEHFTAIEASGSGAKFVRATSLGDFEKRW